MAINGYLITIGNRTFIRQALPAIPLSDGHGWSGLALGAALKAADPRHSYERRLRDALVAMFEKQAPEVARKIADMLPVADEELAEAWRSVLQPHLAETMAEEGMRLGSQIGVQFDPAAVNAAAVDWARGYTYELVKDITSNTQKIIAQATEKFLTTPGMTIGHLTEELLKTGFGPVRAELQAITETTRAVNQATNHYQAEIAKQGIRMERVWNTSHDERVCTLICEPLNGKRESDWIADHPDWPPAHPGCRCATSLRVTAKPKLEKL